MAMIKCSECGKDISDKARICPNCGAPLIQQAPHQQIHQQYAQQQVRTQYAQQYVPQRNPQAIANAPKKKKGSCLKTICIFFGIIILFGIFCSIISGNDNKEEDSPKTEDVEEESKEEEIIEIPEISEEDFKASCQEFNYKTIARNPDDYIGQDFVLEVKIFQTINGKFYNDYDVYYKTYTNDEYDMWMGDFLYVIDRQDKESESYVNVLEDDIIRVYGTFNGLVESKNSLTGTTDNDISIEMKYCELISE